MAGSLCLFSGFMAITSIFVFWMAPKVEITPQTISVDTTAVKSLEGVSRAKWDEGLLLFEGQIIGPESISHDPVTGNIFTGTADGLVWKINKELTQAEIILRTGEDHPQCGSAEYQEICGRVLGLKFVEGDKLIVADAYKGIIAIHVNTKTKQILVQPNKNMLTKSIKLFNSVDVSKEGIVYFTVSSLKWSLHDFIYSFLEGDNTGRVYSYNLVTQELKIIATNLTFANGLVISHDGKSLIVAECTQRRILKIDIKDPTKISVLVDNLPGPTDNIKLGSDGTYFVGIPSVGSLSLLSFTFSHPAINAWTVWLFPKWILYLFIGFESKVLQINEEGHIIRVFDGDNKNISFITEAYEVEENIILGGIKNPYLVVLKKKGLGL